MKQALIIGSTVADVTVRLPHLPVTGEDVIVESQSMSLGGCAYNVSEILRQSGVPYTLFSPVGTGIYGNYVREHLKRKQIPILIPAPAADNGCCYCFVEDDGERTFACYHGAEYRFQKEWFDALDASEIDSVYICGLEIEEETGTNILSYLEEHPEFTVFFAPGPRITLLDPKLLERVFALHPILHLNQKEITSYTGKEDLKAAAEEIHRFTQNTVIVTLGADGCYYYDGEKEETIPGVPAEQLDTIGAGDSHIGAVIAGLQCGKTIEEAIATANRVSAKVVETEGALLSDEAFASLDLL